MRAVNTAECHYFSSKEADNEFLHKLLVSVNKRFFQNRIKTNVLWDVPKGTVSLFIGERGPLFHPGDELYSVFATARTLIEAGQPHSAIPHLEACAAANHADSKLLLSHILKRIGDDRWQKFAREYNQQTATVRAVPAACYYSDSRTIAIHPHLQELNTPQFVLKYLLYHECCHQLIPSPLEQAHPPEFMEWERKAPNRERALAWLEKQGFPTLRTTHAP
ncbi:hypothetical protein [Ketobacter sp.]|uniref:hypothetical protein n=1 Tax=Ketobacter sp. TaxID=2083498 RepID=UPI000F1E3CCA|nr:hypothetical protein [Ketobacter sp.]RLT92532.1 MAG: hypothetical protein D9N14_20535 [Ketobacter sp.]